MPCGIQRITDHGVTELFCVETDLVSSSGEKFKLHKGKTAEPFENSVFGARVFRQRRIKRVDGHLFSISARSADGTFHCAGSFTRRTPQNGEISARETVFFDQFGEF